MWDFLKKNPTFFEGGWDKIPHFDRPPNFPILGIYTKKILKILSNINTAHQDLFNFNTFGMVGYNLRPTFSEIPIFFPYFGPKCGIFFQKISHFSRVGGTKSHIQNVGKKKRDMNEILCFYIYVNYIIIDQYS